MNKSQISNLKSQISNGFTLIELILVMGIFSTIIGITSLSLLNILHKNSLLTTVNVFITDLRQQQLRAMVAEGDAGTTTIYNRGVYLQANSYILFRGTSYIAGDVNNFSVSLAPNTQFVLPDTTIIFDKGSGETNATSVAIKDMKDNSQKTITINKYGVVTSVN